MVELPCAGAGDPDRRDRAGVQLHQRVSRHRQRDGHDHRDPGHVSASRRGARRRPEPDRCLPLGRRCRDHRQRHRRPDQDHGPGHLCRPGRGDHLERDHLVQGDTLVVLARPGGWRARFGARCRRQFGSPVGWAWFEGRGASAGGSVGLRRGRNRGNADRVSANSLAAGGKHRHRLPAQPGALQLAGGAGAWHERCAKDDGSDRPDAGGRRSARTWRGRAQLGES